MTGATPQQRWGAAIARTREIGQNQLVSKSVESLIEPIVDGAAPSPVVIDYAARYVKPGIDDLTVYYPATGSVDQLSVSYTSQGSDSVIQFDLTPVKGEEVNAANLSVSLRWLDERLRMHVDDVNASIRSDRDEVRSIVEPVLVPRWSRARALAGAVRELSIPVRRPETSLRPVPVAPRPLSHAGIEAAAASGEMEWSLSESIADGVVETIQSFGNSLERLPRVVDLLAGAHEEALRDVLLTALNATYRGAATGETFIGEGKSDVLLRWRDRDAFVGECKHWRGSSELSKGLSQLLDRYTLWRSSRIALIVFIDKPADATAVIEKAHAVVDKHPRTLRALDVTEPARRGDYEVTASGDERRPARLTLLPFVLRRTGA